MSLHLEGGQSRTQPCNRCHNVQIYFDPEVRAPSGKLIPLDAQSRRPHECTISNPFGCMWCGKKIFVNNNVVSNTGSGKRIPLDFETEEPHNCTKRPRPPNRELKFYNNRRRFSED